jgi:hypothetical protein
MREIYVFQDIQLHHCSAKNLSEMAEEEDKRKKKIKKKKEEEN